MAAVAAVAVTFASTTPKYIFYFIGDGMGMGHIMAAQQYNRHILGNTTPLLMMQFPIASMAESYSANAPVTDSAASGTALSTGYKTKNYMLGMLPDSTHVYSIAKDLKEGGFGVAVLSSVGADDATPAAFYAHVPYRKHFLDIGMDAARSGYQFIGGSGLRGLKDEKGAPTTLTDSLKAHNVTVLHSADEVASHKGEKVMLLQPSPWDINNTGYTIDSLKGVMPLAAMTRTALDHLRASSPERFFMMVEGGNIDHAAHSNDGGAVIKEILNFNDAIAVAYDFYLQHPDETLIVVTADHNTGGMSIAGGPAGHRSLGYIDSQRVSKDEMSNRTRRILENKQNISWPQMKTLLGEWLGFWETVPVSDEDAKRLEERFNETFVSRNGKEEQTLYNNANSFVVEVFKVMDHATGLRWIANSHTGDPVPVFAIGAGSNIFSHLLNNTDIPRTIKKAALIP